MKNLWLILVLISCSPQKEIQKSNMKILKEVKMFIEPGYWVDKQVELGKERRLKEVRHYNKHGELFQKTSYEIGTDMETQHSIKLSIQQEETKSGEKVKISTLSSDTWDFIKKEKHFYNSEGELVQFQELIIDEQGEELLKNCHIELNNKGDIDIQTCSTSWEGELVYKYFYDTDNFLVKRVLQDINDNTISYEVYENDEYGNPVKRITYSTEASEDRISDISTFENIYW